MGKNKYYVIGYVTNVYMLEEIEAESKEEAYKDLYLKNDLTVSDNDFNDFIKDKQHLQRKCEIDIGIFDSEKQEFVFNIE
jgi:adenine-specific DNA methylase